MAFRSMYFAIKCEADANPDLEQWEWLGGESQNSGQVDVIFGADFSFRVQSEKSH